MTTAPGTVTEIIEPTLPPAPSLYTAEAPPTTTRPPPTPTVDEAPGPDTYNQGVPAYLAGIAEAPPSDPMPGPDALREGREACALIAGEWPYSRRAAENTLADRGGHVLRKRSLDRAPGA